MADTVFCLDITDNTVTGVLVTGGAKTTVVTGCAQAELGEMSLKEGLGQVCQDTGFRGGVCRLSLGSESFSFRNLSLPFADRKKIAQILPFELENISAADIESSQVDFLISATGPEGARIVAASIEKEVLASMLLTLQKAGIDPDSIEIRGVRIAVLLADTLQEDTVLLDICSSRVGLVIVTGGQVTLIRSLQSEKKDTGKENSKRFEELGLLVRQTLLASRIVDLEKKNFSVCIMGDEDQQQMTDQLALQLGVEVKRYQLRDQPLIKINPGENGVYHSRQMDPVLALALKLKVKNKTFNFRKDEFKKKRTVPELRIFFLKAGIPVVLMIAMIVTYLGYDYKKMRDQQTILGQQIVQVFRETLPEVKRIVNPAHQLQVKINEIKKTYGGGEGGTEYGVLSLITEISARIPTSYSVIIKRLVADSDLVRIKAVTGDFNTVDNIQKELDKSPYFKTVTISSANQSPKGEEVRFELKLELRH